ncbi:MAG: copper amine oxidase N-terminal domain-containing protein, partial [Desulfotomaculum sp.]|nr:copper amine oxidase N-terminal domain-containing protein [Desulfotomaculum sp.]
YQVGDQSVKMDTAPMVSEGRTFVPVRFLANALGVSDDDIDFAKGVVTISKPGVATIELTIGEKKLQVDGKTSFMDVAPMVEDGRTMLPARPVAKALGYVVGWNKATQEVTISAK